MAIAAHPDDAELSCAGTLLKEKAAGKKVGVLDLTQGELGTRGSAEIRLQEAAASAKFMQLDCRENLSLPDGFFENSEESIKRIARILRLYQPDIVLCNAVSDRHPDHGRAGKLATDACFYSGLRRMVTENDGETQSPWRPRAVYHYIQDYFIKPDFVVDISAHFEGKMKAIKCFRSQFFDRKSKEPESPIAVENFFDYLKGRMADMGRYIGVDYAEGFTVLRPPGVNRLADLV